MIYIVGAGLFGGVARDLLKRAGIESKTIDDGRPLAGSWPAGCIIKPSWLTKIPGRDGATEALDQLYGLRSMPLRTALGKLDGMMHVHPGAILRPPDIKATVTHIDPAAGTVYAREGKGTINVLNGTVLVAAGVWCRELLPEHFADVPLTGLQGCSQRFAGTLPEACLRVWAPYKQSVAFEINPGVIWFGDGTALKPESWESKHEQRSLQHAHDLGIDTMNHLETRVGIRPYVKGQQGWFRKVGARCYVSTGGAKNGVVLAAAQALQLLRELE